jgi:hypothetical protein
VPVPRCPIIRHQRHNMINSTSNTEVPGETYLSLDGKQPGWGGRNQGKQEGLLLRMDLQLKSETKSVVLFSVFGLGAGVASAELTMRLMSGSRGPASYRPFFWSGVFLLVALAGSFEICRQASWPRFGNRLGRSILAALVILVNPFPSMYVGIFSGIATAAIVASRPPHSSLFYAAPIMAAFICGGLASAFMIAIALFVFTEVWDATAWTSLALSAVAASIVALAANPNALMALRYMSKGQTNEGGFLPAMLMFLIVDLTLCSACAGYWIAHTSLGPD